MCDCETRPALISLEQGSAIFIQAKDIKIFCWIIDDTLSLYVQVKRFGNDNDERNNRSQSKLQKLISKYIIVILKKAS